MDLKSSILSIYSNISQGKTEGTYEALQEVKQDPNYIPTLLDIILTDPNNQTKIRAAIDLKNMFLSLEEEAPQELKDHVATSIIQILSQNTEFTIQQLLAETFDELALEGTEQTIFQFAQNALQGSNENLVTAAVLLMQTIPDLNQESLELVSSLITAGTTTTHPIPAYELGFIYGSTLFELFDQGDEEIDPTTIPFYDYFHSLFEQCLTAVENNIQNKEIYEPLLKVLNYQLDEEENLSPFVDGSLVYNHFFPFIGNEEIIAQVPPDVQADLANTINLALKNTNLVDVITESELSQSVVDQYFLLAGMLASINLEDRLPLSKINIFEDLCTYLNIDADFINVIIEKAMEVIEDENFTPAAMLALAFCFEGKAEEYADRLDEIIPTVCDVVVSEHQLARDCASQAISRLADLFEDLLDDYLPTITEACVNSFTMQESDDISSDVIKTLSNVFRMTSNTDEVFEDAYTFLFSLMEEMDSAVRLQVFSCIVSLCAHAEESMNAHFDDIYQLMASILTSDDQDSQMLIPSSIDCLKSLSVLSPTQFAPHIQEYATTLVQLLDVDDVDITVSVLNAMASAASAFPEFFLENLEEISPKLLEMGSQDTNMKLATDVLQQIEKQKAVNIEQDEDMEDDDEEKDKQKPYRIPSLALCILCTLLNKAPTEVVAAYVPQIMERIQVQIQGFVEEAIAQACKAAALLAELVGKNGISLEEFQTVFIDMAVNTINSTKSNLDICESIDILDAVLSFFPRESLSEENIGKIIKIVQQFLSDESEVSIKTNDEQVLEDYSKLIQRLITVFDESAVEHLGDLIQPLMDLLTNNKAIYKAFALPILGFFVECAGTSMTEDVLTTIYMTAKGLIVQKNDQTAVYVINQFVSGAPELIRQDLEDLIGVLNNKISQPAKKARQYKEFITRIASLIAEFQRVYFGDAFDQAPYLSFILSNTPSIYDESENLGLIRFFVWAANKTNGQHANEFLAAGIRTLMMNDDEIGDALLTDPIFVQFKQILGTMIQANPASVGQVCGGDELKAQRVMSFFE